jgi:hypothetical protein
MRDRARRLVWLFVGFMPPALQCIIDARLVSAPIWDQIRADVAARDRR